MSVGRHRKDAMRQAALATACLSAVLGVSSCERARDSGQNAVAAPTSSTPESHSAPAEPTGYAAAPHLPVSEQRSGAPRPHSDERKARELASVHWYQFVEKRREMFSDESGRIPDEFRVTPGAWSHVTKTGEGMWDLYAYLRSPGQWAHLTLKMGNEDAGRGDWQLRIELGPDSPFKTANPGVETDHDD